MTPFKKMTLLSALAAIAAMEPALASKSGAENPVTEEESSTSQTGQHAGVTAKKLEHTYKENILGPAKALKKGFKEGLKKEKHKHKGEDKK